MSRYRERMMVEVLACPAALAAARRLIEAALARQEAVCSPNSPGAEELRRRGEIGQAEHDAAAAETDLVAAIRTAAKTLAMEEIQPA